MIDKTRDSIEKIKELTEGIDFCMLTTIDSGHLRSRPMSTQKFDFDGDLWFLTSDDTHKVEEIAKDNRVNVAYSAPGFVFLKYRSNTLNIGTRLQARSYSFTASLRRWLLDRKPIMAKTKRSICDDRRPKEFRGLMIQ